MSIARQINEVLREVALDADDHVVRLEQTFPTGPDDLWDACTAPTRLARWFEPVEGDLRPGGRYRLTDSGTEGTIEACEEPRRLQVTWEYGGDLSRVTVTIDETADGRARLALEHTGANDDHWNRFGPAAGGAGWDTSLLALAWHLAGDPRAVPAEMAEFDRSEDGQTFLADSVAAWQDAHRRAGGQDAPAAAERALAAYRSGSW